MPTSLFAIVAVFLVAFGFIIYHSDPSEVIKLVAAFIALGIGAMVLVRAFGNK